MRKLPFQILRILLIAALCLTCGVFLPAGAESSGQILSVRVAARPDSLLEPGDVTLTFTIDNRSEYDVENITLSSADGLESEPVGRVAAGSTESFTRAHAVTQAELDAGEITFILSHDDPLAPERKVNYGIHAALRQSDTQIQAQLIRRLSTDRPAVGSTVTVTYRIQNTGNVPLNSLRVEDAFGDYIGHVDALEPGASEVLVSRVTVTEPTASHASLHYCADLTGEKSYAVELEDLPIILSAPQLDLQFSANTSAFSTDTADVLLILTNAGNVDYENVSVTDDLSGAVLAEGLSIPAGGAPVEVERAYAVRGDGSYRWRVTGRCADGTALNAVTETVRIEPRANENPPQLLLTAEVETPRIRKAGDVCLHIRLENAGGAALTDVVLSDAERGDLRTFAVLPAESEIARDFTFRVESDEVFRLRADCTTADGEALHAEAAEASVTIAADGVLPAGERERFIEFTGTSIKIGGSSLFAVLLIAGIVILLILIAMLLLASRRARFEKQVRIAVEKRRKQAKSKKGRVN